MTPEVHPVDALLRAAVGDPAPSLADQMRGQRALAEVIAAEHIDGATLSRSPRRSSSPAPWWRPASLATAALVLLFAVVAVAGLLRPQPVTALGELAEVAERVASPTAGASEYVYTRTSESSLSTVAGAELGLDHREFVSYLQRFVVERWEAPDGSVHQETIFEAPKFFDAEAQAAYAGSPLETFEAVGEVRVDNFAAAPSILSARAWPETPEDLLSAIQVYITNEGNAVVAEARVMELAADLLRATGAKPELRSAVLGALDLMDVEIQERSNTQSVIVSLQYTLDVRHRLELEFDANAFLIREKLVRLDASTLAGTPAGAVVQESMYSPARIVDSLDAP